MKRELLFCCFLLSVFGFFYDAAFSSSSAWAGESESFILKLRSGQVVESSLSALESEGIEVIDRIPQLGMIVVNRLPAKGGRAHRMMAYSQKNGSLRTMDRGLRAAPRVSESTSFVQWDMEAVHAPEAWALVPGTRDVRIAISDTGAFEHGQLLDNFWRNPGETGKDSAGKDRSKNKKDDDGNGFVDDHRGWNTGSNTNNTVDPHYHGTHVSGTVGAFNPDGKGLVKGVAPVVSLMQIPFIGRDGWGKDADAIKGIIYASDNGAKAINASWGGGGAAPALKDAILYAQAKGVLFVASAGNDGEDNDGKNANFPASYDCENIISVAATGRDNELTGWSNYGAKNVDLAAPGDDILSTFNPMYSPLYREFYLELSGTSMAAPHVTGAVAMVYAANPKLSWRQVKEIVLSSVKPLRKLQGKVATGGLLNVEAAVKAALATR